MSNAKSPGGGTKKPADSSQAGTGKKSKSKGFIETSGYKPGWLETGPLPADILPEPAAPVDDSSIAEEFAALQEALQKYYGAETMEDAPDSQPPVEDVADAAEPLNAASPTTEGPPEWILRAIAPEAIASEAAVPEAAVPEAVAPATVAPSSLAPSAPPIAAPPAALPVEEPALPAQPLAAAPPETAVSFDALAVVESPAPPLDEQPAELDHPLSDELLVEQWAGDQAATAEPVVAEPAAEPAAAKPEKAPRAPRRPLRRPSRLSAALLALSLLLLAAAAFIYFVNPFTRLALGMASLARPVASPSVAPPGAADNGLWCLQGSFPTGDALPRLMDDGAQGDVVANDDVFSLEFPIPTAGSYRWQVVNCDNTERAFPPAMAWITTSQPNQVVTFVFDSNERADRLFFPIPYAVSAFDGADEFHVVGSFQGGIADDASARLEPISNGLYQQVRRIARAGSYESYVIAGDETQAIDAYGRTTEPIPFAFETDSNGEYVVFLVDIDRGRASVMYDMPPLVTRLAYGGGHRPLSLALAGLAGLLLLGLLLREAMLRNRRLWMETGCPRCHEQELMRISRRSSDRLLHVFGIPAYRYRCRNCTWEGTRLSEAGRSISPGATITRIEGLH